MQDTRTRSERAFAPEDLALVRGDPSERRRFLDELLVSRQPRYAGVRSDYERVLKQRNALRILARMVARLQTKRPKAKTERPPKHCIAYVRRTLWLPPLRPRVRDTRRWARA